MLSEEKLAELERLNAELRPVPDHPGYMAHPSGAIWSFSNWRGAGPRALAPNLSRCGYHRVAMTNAAGVKRMRAVHRMMCLAFYGPPPEGKNQVRHLNGIRTDNRIENLRWGDAQENAGDRQEHGTTCRGEAVGNSKLSDADSIAAKHLSKGVPISFLAAWLGVDVTALNQAERGKTRAHEPSLDDLLSRARDAERYEKALRDGLDALDRMIAQADRQSNDITEDEMIARKVRKEIRAALFQGNGEKG